jgi:predicted RND superfamily exporter protein
VILEELSAPPAGDVPPPGAGAPSVARRLVRALRARRGTWLILFLLLAVGVGPGMLRLRSDNSPESFFVRGSERLASYAELRRLFPGDQALRVVVRGDQLFTREGLTWLGHLEQDVARLPGVTSASGLPAHHQRTGWPPRDPEAFRAQAMANHLDRQAGWITADGGAATLLVELAEQDRQAQRKTLAAIEELVADPPAGIAGEVVGLPSLDRALDASSREIGEVYMPLLIGMALVLLLLVVRDLRAILALLAYVGLGLMVALAPLGYGDVALNLILAILPPLLFTIGLATAVHLLIDLRHRAETMREGEAAIAATFDDKAWPLLWSGFTSVLGFASLLTSPVQPIRELGLWAAWGLVALTALAFTFLPLMLPWRPRPPGHALEIKARGQARSLAGWACDHAKPLLWAMAATALIALAGLPRIAVESNALRYLKPDHALRLGIERLETGGVGTAAVELLVHVPDEAPFRRAVHVDGLAQLALAIDQRDDVLGVLDAGTLLRDTAKDVIDAPFNAALQQQIVLESMAQDVQGRGALSRLVSEDGRTARLTVFVRTGSAEELAQTLSAIEDAAAGQFPEATVAATGQYPLLLESQGYLISTLLSSLGGTLLTIGLILRFLLGSWRLTLLALIPSSWPILCILGVMGYAGIPLDIATVMVSSIVLGLIIDDTLHTLGIFRGLAAVHGQREAALRSLEVTGPAFLLTGMILIAGFGVCGLSDFGPIARFGGLAAGALALGVTADLVVVPLLLFIAPPGALARMRGR